MKLLFVTILVCCVVWVKSQALTPEAKAEQEKQMMNTCKEKEKATDDDFKILTSREVPQTRTGKCLIACLQESLGLVSNGKISMDGMKTFAHMAHGTDHAIDVAIGLVEDCKDVADADRCEMSYKFLNCLIENAKKRNVDPKKIF